MAYTVGRQRPSGSLYVWLQRAQEAGEISERRKGDLLKQCQRLA